MSVLPLMLTAAGCRLVEQGRRLVVVDRDGVELERGTRGRWEWLCAASAATLIERWAEALGLNHELHLKQLKMRLWREGEDPEAAPWQPFEAALGWLAEVEATRAVEEAQQLAVKARRWLVQFIPLLEVLLQSVSRLRAQTQRQVMQLGRCVEALGQVAGVRPVAWVWAAGRGPPDSGEGRGWL